MKQFPNEIYKREDKTDRYKKEREFLWRQGAVYYTKVSELSDEQLDIALNILRISNDDECSKW